MKICGRITLLIRAQLVYISGSFSCFYQSKRRKLSKKNQKKREKIKAFNQKHPQIRPSSQKKQDFLRKNEKKSTFSDGIIEKTPPI